MLDHLGKPDIKGSGYQEWRRHFSRLAELPNVCCKLSGLVTEADWTSWTPAMLRPYLDAGHVVVMGGFIGSTPSGITTTLGRGASDYSAAIAGAAGRNCARRDSWPTGSPATAGMRNI